MAVLVATVFFLFSSNISAQEPSQITPTHNIVNNVISQRSLKIVLEYGNEVTLDEGSSVKLFENDAEKEITYQAIGTTLEIGKSSYYIANKTYRLNIQNINTSVPGKTLNDIEITFRYDSYKSWEIGRTVQNRRIMAHSLGEGSQVYLFIGSIHGNEKNSTNLVNLLMRNFILQPSWLPDDSTLIFVPVLNVDGYVKNNRLNVRGVDLNRNSKTSDWSRTTYWGATRLTNGGGLNPNSEPETRAIQLLIKVYDPYLTISYHSAAGYAITNGPLARSTTKAYAKYSGYKYVDQSSGGTGFSYPITGDLTNWINQKLGYRAMTVELKSREYSEITPNLNAVKYILGRY